MLGFRRFTWVSLCLSGCVLMFTGCGKSDTSEAPSAAAGDPVAAAPQPEPPCASNAELSAWCGFKNPEDLTLTPDGRYLLATGFSALPETYVSEMLMFDLTTRRKADIPVTLADNTWGDAACTRVNTDFSPHGLSLIQRPDGAHQVAITNHQPRETVEFFELTRAREGWSLTWRGCVDAPAGEGYAPMFNDVALTRDGSFYASEMYDRLVPLEAQLAEVPEQSDTGSVWHWTPEAGFSELPNTAGASPNGVVLSADENVLFINYWLAGKTVRYNLATQEMEAEHSGGRPDNVTLSDGVLWVATHDVTLEEYQGACGHEDVNCPIPFTIYRLSADDLSETGKWSFDSDVYSFATVATPANGKVWLGTAHGDRIGSFTPDA